MKSCIQQDNLNCLAEKAVCKSVFLTTWHCSAELTKMHSFRQFSCRFFPLGYASHKSPIMPS